MALLRATPFVLTGLRILLGPAFLLLYWRGAAPGGLLLIVALAVATDWLDGLSARRWNAVSTAGKLLDPFADALFCMVVFVSFALRGRAPAWIVSLLVLREALVTLLLRPVALWRGVVVPASLTGKVKTTLQFCAMILVLAGQLRGMGDASPLRAATFIAFLAVLMFSLISAAGYAVAAVGAVRAARTRG